MDRAALTSALVTDPGRTALVLDFDGVLAPISADPAASALDPATGELLAGLAQRLGLVAVLSGRPLPFLRERLTVAGVALHGSYGVQWWDGRTEHVLDGVAAWQAGVDQATAALHLRFDDEPGIYVEDKGIAVAVHWRQATDRAMAQAIVVGATDALVAATGLRAEPGKLVVELRPPLDEDKGTALHRLAAGFDTVAYLGDDLGDLPALAAVRERGGWAVAVGHGAETAPEVLAAGDLVMDGVAEVADWLRELRGTLVP